MDAPTCPECMVICVRNPGYENFICTNCSRAWTATECGFSVPSPFRTSEKSKPAYEDIKKGSRPDVPFIIKAIVKGYRCAKCKRVETSLCEVVEVRKGESSLAKGGSIPNGWKTVDWDVWLCPTDWEAFKLAFAEWCNSTKVIASLREVES